GRGRALRGSFASRALLCCAGLLVGLWPGATEAHYDFFVVITLLRLYVDWLRFALALVFVIGHHVALGLISPLLVFDHPGSPWLWALVHGGFVLAWPPPTWLSGGAPTCCNTTSKRESARASWCSSAHAARSSGSAPDRVGV